MNKINATLIHRILIVDDNEVDRFIFRKTLISVLPAREISEVASGTDALTLINTLSENEEPLPDLIILDQNMPSLSGIAFLEEFVNFSVKHPNKCIIIMAVNHVDENEKQVAKSYTNVAEYFLKPISAKMLRDIFEPGTV